MNLNSRRRVIFIVATGRPLVLAAIDAPSVWSAKRPGVLRAPGTGRQVLSAFFQPDRVAAAHIFGVTRRDDAGLRRPRTAGVHTRDGLDHDMNGARPTRTKAPSR